MNREAAANPDPPITRADLLRAVRGEARGAVPATCACAAALGAYAWLLQRYWGGAMGDIAVRYGPWGCLAAVVAASAPCGVVAVALLRRALRHASRRRAAACPFCRATLTGMPGLVIATGRCWKCRMPLFPHEARPAPPPDAPAMEAYASAARRQMRGIERAALFGPVSLIVGVTAAPWCAWRIYRAVGASPAGDRAAAALALVTVSAACVLPLVALVRDETRPMHRCPACGGALTMACHGVVIATRRCPHCGAGVVAGDPRDAPPGALTRGELQQRAAGSRTRLARAIAACVLVAGAAELAAIAPLERVLRVAEASPEPWVGQTAHFALMFGVSVPLVAALACAALLAGRGAGVPRCPHCGSRLDERAAVVLLTGNCGACGDCAIVPEPGAP